MASDRSNWERVQREVAAPLSRALSGLGVSAAEADHAAGAADVNCYEVANRTGDCGVRGVFPVTSLMSHDCAPNTRMAMDGDSCSNRCVASRNVAAGSQLTTAYVHLHLCTSLRRARLRDDWFFECTCERCRDPTELGTFLDGVRCLRCGEGVLLARAPLEFESDWICDKCEAVCPREKVKNVVKKLLREKESLKRADLKGYMDFLEKSARFYSIVYSNIY